MLNLKEIRIAKGVSQLELAQAVGVTVPAVSSWETERFSPSLENLIKIAAFLECSVDDLLKDPNKEGSNE